jgi:hypothetical protein
MRFLEHHEKFFPEHQAAFRKQRSTTENLIVLEELKRHGNAGEKVFGFSIDLTRAFASVDVELLLFRLQEKEVSSKFSKTIQELFSHNRFSVILNGRHGKFFPINKGLGEGTSISPALFFVFLRISKN